MSKGKKGDSKKKRKLKNIKKYEIIILIMLCSSTSNFLHEALIKPIERIEVSFANEYFEAQGSLSFYESDNDSAQDVD